MMNHSESANRTARHGASKNWRARLGRLLVGCLSFAALDQIAGAADEGWVLLPEPKFMGHKVTLPLAAAKKTVLAAAKITEYGAEFPTKEQWATAGQTDETLAAAGKKQASTWWKQINPELIRDPRKVVQYARVASDKVPAAATVIAPEFWQHFEGIFGPRMRVVIPNRSTVFVFPDVAIDLDAYTKMVMLAWRSAQPKVSLEVFELSEKGLRAIGQFEEP